MKPLPVIAPTFLLRIVRLDDDSALDELYSRSAVRERIGRRPQAVGPLERAIAVEGVLAGMVGIVPSGAYEGKDVELYCALREAYEGRGLALASCRGLLSDESVRTTNRRVLACVHPTNTDGQSLATRLGFVKTCDSRPLSADEIWVLALDREGCIYQR